MNELEPQHLTIHGHEVGYFRAGEGPALLLIHGMAGSSSTWKSAMRLLARDYTVIAPDLLGHGRSDKPRTDYSLGAFAAGLRDLLIATGIDAGHRRGPVPRRRHRHAALPTSTPSRSSAWCW